MFMAQKPVKHEYDLNHHYLYKRVLMEFTSIQFKHGLRNRQH